MSYSDSIRDHIANTPLGQVITTREVLHLGTRGAVDMTLSRMVKAVELIRVAWGAFVRAGSERPPDLAVIQAKAKAFGRTITSHGETLAQEFGFLPEKPSLPTFCISAGSTSFIVMDEEKKFLATCNRKRHFEDRAEGRAIRALWKLGKEAFLSLPYERLSELQSSEQIRLAKEAAWMPAWMSDRFVRAL
jgi:hypothetical protein